MKIQPSKRIREITLRILQEKNIPEDNPNAIHLKLLSVIDYLDEQWSDEVLNCPHEFTKVKAPICSLCGISEFDYLTVKNRK